MTMPVMTDEGAEAAMSLEAEADAPAGESTTDATAEPGGSGDRDAEPVADAGVAEPAAPRRGHLVPALIGALVAAVAGAGFFGWQFWQQHQLSQARDEAQRAAVSYAQVLTSVDSDKVDENFKQVLDGATGEFKDMFTQSSAELRPLLVENKATAHGVVLDSAVQSASRDKAVVLLFVDQSVSNARVPDRRIDRSRMRMTLERVDGVWRAAKVELP